MAEAAKRVTRRNMLIGAAVSVVAMPYVARAAYPEKPVTLVVPFPPGGPNDIIGRIAAKALSDAFGAQAIVENRPGAGGAIAVVAVARADPDGYTTVLPSGVAYVTQPLLNPIASFKTADLRAVSNVASGPSVIAVKSDLPVSSLEELLALARKQPGALSYGSSGVGTTLHLGGELFKSMAGLDILHVPYKGTSEVVLDLVGGRVDMSIISPLVARKLADDGKIKPLATTGKTRPKGWEQTPTVAEAGVPGYELDGWYPLLAPKDTPDEAIARLSEALVKGLKAPDAAGRLTDLGFTPVASTVAEVEAQTAAETEKWGRLIRDAKLTAG